MSRRRGRRSIKMTRKEICDSNIPISYAERKRGIKCNLKFEPWNISEYNDYDEYKNSGKEFDGSKEIFKVSNRQFQHPLYNNIQRMTTYIYIISKTVGKEIYFKIGEGGKGEEVVRDDAVVHTDGRLGDARTFLIPGLEDVGYKVHYVFFFDKDIHHNKSDVYIGQFIENQVHATLKKAFPQANISFLNQRASEWYLVQKKEIQFFIGFIFDIIASYHYKTLKPLAIWKYSEEVERLEDFKKHPHLIELPEVNDVQSRLKKSTIYEDAMSKIAFLRQQNRPAAEAVIDLSVATKKDDINTIKQILGMTRGGLTYNFRLNDINFRARRIGLPLTSSTGKLAYVYYVTFTSDAEHREVIDVFKSNKISLFHQYKGDLQNIEYDISVANFLEILAKHLSSEEYAEWELKDIQKKFSSKTYNEHVETIPIRQTQLPAFYFNKRVQRYYGEQFVKSNDIDEDYSVSDVEKNKMKSWKMIKYDVNTQMIMRQEYDTLHNTMIDNTNELVPIFDMMKLKRVMMDLKTKSKKWKCSNHHTFMVNDITYGKGDIIQLKDDIFIYFDDSDYNIPDEHRHNNWTTYKITRVCDDRHSGDVLNPYIDVREMNPDGTKFVSKEVWILSVPFLSEKIKMLRPKRITKEPKYSENDYIVLTSKKYPLNTLDARWNIGKQTHYVKITKVERSNGKYGIRFMAPFDKNKMWDRVPANKTYVHTVDIEMLDAYTHKLVDDSKKWPTLQKYETELPFMIYEASEVMSHYPDGASSHKELVSSRSASYDIDWERGTRGDKLEKSQRVDVINKLINKRPSTLKLRTLKKRIKSYWSTYKDQKKKGAIKIKTKKRRHPMYDLSHIDDVNMVTKKAKYFWKRLRYETLKRITSTPERKPLTHTIPKAPRDGFRIGDEIWIYDKQLKLGYVCYYFVDTSDNVVYGVFYSSDPMAENPIGDTVSEYTHDELVELLRTDDNPLNTLEEINTSYNGVYSDMIKRMKNLIRS